MPTLESFHVQIVQWQKEGASYRQVADLLEERGLKVHFTKVDRYCKRHGIVKTEMPKAVAKPPTSMPVSTVTPAEDSLFGEPPKPAPAIPQTTTKNPARTGANTHDLQGVRAIDEAKRQPSKVAAPQPAGPPPVEPTHPRTAPEFIASSSLKNMPLVKTGQAGGTPHPQAPSVLPEKWAVASLPLPTMAPRAPWQEPPPLFAPLPRIPLWTHDLELMHFGDQGDQWTLQDACEGTFILGASGSGKTTGSGRALSETFLASGFGGLVLTVKADEARLWEAYARATGRAGQLCIVRPGGKFKLNFLDYESRRPGEGAGLIENLVSLFYTIIDVRAQGQNDSQLLNFWTNAGKELIRNTFRILSLATPKLSLAEVCRFIIESPHRVHGKDGSKAAGKWFTACMDCAIAQAKGTPNESVIEASKLYWLDYFFNLAPDTRSCVVTTFTAMADIFIEPAIHDLFCTDTTITPEAVLDGAIIVIDLPLKTFDAVGLFVQSIWKYLFQKAIERREDSGPPARRPAFLWIDEAQYFHSAYDGLFQATARSARCATVYLTQNISNFYGITGASRSRERVDGFLGNLNTKIFHCNNDHTSNVWAAEQIGKYKINRFSSNISEQQPQPNDGFLGFFRRRNQVSTGMQEQIDYAVQPSAFLNLRTGGERFDFLVDAYFVKGGATFSTGRHYFETVFQQEFL